MDFTTALSIAKSLQKLVELEQERNELLRKTFQAEAYGNELLEAVNDEQKRIQNGQTKE